MVLIAKFARFGAQAARQLRITPTSNRSLRNFSVSSLLAAERRYTIKHEWVELEGQVGIIGISNYAQEALGDVVFAQLPDPGTLLKQDDECGALESVKAASEIYTPLSGKVSEKNTAVEDTPALVNSSCYEKGWLFKINLSDPAEFEKLMTEEQYQNYLKTAEV